MLNPGSLQAVAKAARISVMSNVLSVAADKQVRYVQFKGRVASLALTGDFTIEPDLGGVVDGIEPESYTHVRIATVEPRVIVLTFAVNF